MHKLPAIFEAQSVQVTMHKLPANYVWHTAEQFVKATTRKLPANYVWHTAEQKVKVTMHINHQSRSLQPGVHPWGVTPGTLRDLPVPFHDVHKLPANFEEQQQQNQLLRTPMLCVWKVVKGPRRTDIQSEIK
jgi:hypothetical protein